MKVLAKKCLSIILALFTTFFIAIESNAAQEFETAKSYSESVNSDEPRVTGLINSYSFSANKDGYNLIIRASITCVTSVVKSGIKEMVIQRRVSTDYSWSDYLTYEDIYEENNIFALSKSIPVTTGYQYRVVATLYAKKSLLSTEKIEVTSNIVWI